MNAPHLAWAKGGAARFVSIVGEQVVLTSTTPAPPGARLEADLVAGVAEGEAKPRVKVKSHGSKKEENGTFTLKGRLVEVNRVLRERLVALLAS